MTYSGSVFSLLEFNEDDGRTVALALTCLASELASREVDRERQARKHKVVGIKCDALLELGLSLNPMDLRSTLTKRVEPWEEAKRSTLLVELALADAFAPYELRVEDRDRLSGLEELARLLGLPRSRAKDIDQAVVSARKAHRHIAWGKIAISATVGAVVLAAGGFVAAPLIGGALGAGAGLSGAAATAHGLAILGGGSLAAGGGGMAGGIFAITSAGAVAGTVGAGGAVALWNAGYAAAVSELVKLQVAFREVLLRSQLRQLAAAQVVEKLNEQLRSLRTKLNEEKELNDKKARRIGELERVIQAYEDAREWVQQARPEAEARA